VQRSPAMMMITTQTGRKLHRLRLRRRLPPQPTWEVTQKVTDPQLRAALDYLHAHPKTPAQKAAATR